MAAHAIRGTRWRQAARRALLLAALAALGGTVFGQLAPLPYDQGAAGLGLALRRLGVTGRVLYVTAHPDDEHNGVLVRLSRGEGLRTGLLTLTRGDGGQNEIGPELFEALGVLRTEELMAVHRYDAVEQYFTRAYEFGYSFSVEETLEKWGKEPTLGDVVKVVRAFRPDVMLTLPLEGAGGGQHHQAAGRLAVEAFRAAADPARFPEHARQGLRPWQARKIYRGGVGGGEAAAGPPPVAVATGALDPLLGMSWQEIGSVARASHRSQGTSQLKEPPGTGQGVYVLVDSEPAVKGPEADILDGVDVSLAGLARFARAAEPASAGIDDELAALQGRADAARAAFDPRAPEAAVEPLAAYLTRLREVRARLEREGGRPDLLERLADEENDALDALALAQGIAFEVLADDDQVVPGQAFTVNATVVNQGGRPFELETVTLRAPEGWKAGPVEPIGARSLAPGQRMQARFEVTAAPGARLSQPYWRRPPGADRFELDVPAHDTLPWSPPELVASLRYRAAGTDAAVDRPAQWRYEATATGGEKQKVVQVVPALSVRMTPSLSVVPLLARGPKEFRVTVVNNVKGPGAARVRLEAPAGWTVEPGETAPTFRFEGEEVAARFLVTPPARVAAGTFALKAVATRDGRAYVEGVQVIAYPHVQERRLVRPAAARVRVLDARVAAGISVGYVMGAGDEVADAVRQLGAPLTLLGPDDLAYGDLSRFTTIVTGIRAYQTRPDLKANHHRLLRYVEQGGHLVVQYNKFEFNVLVETPRAGGMIYSRPATTDSPFAPYPAAVSSNRVSDENAPVQVLVPGHALFTRPNRIGPEDWSGWVQERGLYFLEARDPRYQELLSLTDPFPLNPGQKKGALVEARVGRGTWTYVGLGLFRQIPAGTPGAWRLLANLVSRGRGV